MYCTKCGHVIDGDAKFCPDCGSPVVEPPQRGSSPTPSPLPKRGILRSKRFRFVFLPLVGLVVLIVIAALFAESPEENGGESSNIAGQLAPEQLPKVKYNPETAGSSRIEPSPFGQPIVHKGMEVTVLNVIRGWPGGSSFFTPDTDHEWTAVSLRLRNLGPAEKTETYNPIEFRVTGSRGVIYDKLFTPDTSTPLRSGEFFGGAEITGEIVQQVHKADTKMVLIYSPPFQGSRYLSLEMSQ